MSERFINFEQTPQTRFAHEERVLKSEPKTKAGRWLAAMMLAMTAEAIVPSAAKAQDFFQWYNETFSTRFDLDAAPGGGGGMLNMTIRERSEEDRRRIRHEPETSIIEGFTPSPFEEFLPREMPVSSSTIESGHWETDLIPDHIYIDERGRRFVMRTLLSGASDEDAFLVGYGVHAFLPGRVIPRDSRRVAIPGGGSSEHFLFEAPAVIDSARIEGNWYEDLRPGAVYADDHERLFTVAVVDVAPGASPSGLSESVRQETENRLHTPLVLLGERRFPGRDALDVSHVRFLLAERIVDSSGRSIDPEVREREAMRLAWERAHETE